MPDPSRLVADDFPTPTREALAARGGLRADALHPSTAAFKRRMARYGGLTDSVSVGYARRRFRGMTPLLSTYPAVAAVTDRTVAGPHGSVPVRIVRPRGDSATRPAVVWLPGGGFVIGDVVTAEPTARHLAARTGAVVIAVDYRKAPEHRLDAAFDDALAVVRWVHANAAGLGIDPDRIAVGGDSAGGNIAAVVAQELAASSDRGPELALQLLVYPAVSVEYEPARTRDTADGTLNEPTMLWFESHVAASVDPRSRRYYPLAAEDVSGLPPAVIVTAGYDPLRDEAITYLDRLRAEGVRAEHLHYPDEIHGFLTMDLALDNATVALDAVGELVCEIMDIDEALQPEDRRGGLMAELLLEKGMRRARVLAVEAVEAVAYRYIRGQRATLRLLGLPSARDLERVNSQMSRLEAQLGTLDSRLRQPAGPDQPDA